MGHPPIYTNSNQIVGYSYDANGNVLNDGTNTYTWDPNWQVMTSVNGAGNFIYDALGRMVEANGQPILYSPVGRLARLATGGASYINALIPTPAGRLDYIPSATYTRLDHLDWLGSSRFMSNPHQNTAVGAVAYAPFGESYNKTSAMRLDFTDQFQDSNIANTYDFLARKMNVVQGRWLSPDPAGLAAMDLTNPQTFNRYAYVGNNPLAAVDPLGLMVCIPCINNRGGGGGLVDPDTGLPMNWDPPDWGVWISGPISPTSPGLGDCESLGIPCGMGSPDSGGLLGDIWSNVLGLPTGLNCPQVGGVSSFLCGGISPIMDSDTANNGNPQPDPKVKQCVTNFYNSKLGTVVKFGSPLSLLPGWNPQFGDNLKEWVIAVFGKGGGLFGSGATSGTTELTTLNGMTTVGSWLELKTGLVLGGIEKAAPPAMALATLIDVGAHIACGPAYPNSGPPAGTVP